VVEGSAETHDGQVIARSVRDPSAFGEIFDRHFTHVWRYLASRGGREVADDLAAQVFEVALDRRARFRPEVPDAGPWLLGIATNLLRRHWRSERTRWRALARMPVDSASLDPAEGHDRLDAVAQRGPLAAAFRQLGRRDREIIALLAWADLTYEEAAVALDVPVGTVRSRTHRARQRLRELLDRDAATTVREP
jgi:RNA polymerase sigma-70 factor, ECF subfamily